MFCFFSCPAFTTPTLPLSGRATKKDFLRLPLSICNSVILIVQCGEYPPGSALLHSGYTVDTRLICDFR